MPLLSSRSAVGAVVAALGLVFLAGCSGANPTDPEASPEAAGISLAEVEEAGVLNVGTEGTYRPFSFHADGAGELTGYDVEVIEAVGRQLGVEIDFHETQWDGMFAGLDAGRFDTIANQVSITPERSEKYEFTTPYTISSGVVVTRSDDDSVSSFDDLAGKRTAQSLTSNWGELAQSSGAEVEPVEGWAQAVALLEQGRVDATINDKLTVLDYQQTENNQAIKIAAETDDNSEVAFVFPAGSPTLVDAVDEALDELHEDGTLTALSEKYFGEDVSS